MPTLNCRSCGKEIRLGPVAYWNVENVEIRCPTCQVVIKITLRGGELKKAAVLEENPKKS